MSIKHALKWSFLSEIASKAIQPLVFVILARLLTPEDYGVVAAAIMVISFSQIFWDAGMSKAIIQFQGDRTAAANAAFWINNVLGVVVAGVVVVISEIVSDKIFHDPRVALVLQVMALQVVLSALVSIHTALLQKDMRFKHLFWVRLATVAIPGLVSIPLAWYGMGYWALVAGTLVGQVMQVVILWKTSPWKPCFSFDATIAKQLARFGGWVAATGLLAWFYLWADSLIVGMYLGSHELGLYRTGNAFVMMIFGFLFGPMMPVLYSYLSGIQDNRERVKEVLLKVVRVISLISIPLGVFLYLSSQLVADFVFGENWRGVEIVIGISALTHGLAWLVGVNGEVYRVLGRPNIETWIMGLCLIFYLPAYLIAAQISLEVFLWARLLVVFPALMVHWIFLRKLNLSPSLSHLKAILYYSLSLSLLIVLPELIIFTDKVVSISYAVFLLISIAYIIAVTWLLMRPTIIELVVYFRPTHARVTP